MRISIVYSVLKKSFGTTYFIKKSFLLVCLFYLLNVFLFSAKLILPNKIKSAENLTKETLICNLADSGVYEPLDFQIINDFLVIGNHKPIEIVKLDLSGKVLIRRDDKEGRGPGEFVFCLSPRQIETNIAFYDIPHKILFYDFNLNFAKEIKLQKYTRDFLYIDKQYLVFPERAISNYYLSKYTLSGDLKKKFGEKLDKVDKKDELYYLNRPRLLAYDKIRKTVWIDMYNKYELKSYYNEILKDKINAEPELFEKYRAIDEETGEKETKLDGRGIKLISTNDKLFYFYSKNKNTCCDVFDSQNITHIKRSKLKNIFKLISHLRENIFYGISYDKEGDPLLFKIELSGI